MTTSSAKEPQVEIIEARMLPAAVADEIVATIGDCVSEHGDCSLVLSGGSTPGSIYRTLSRPPRVTDVEWEKVRVYWGDERWVPEDHSQSNYRMAKETLLSHIPEPGPDVVPVDTRAATPQAGASDYERRIREREQAAAGSVPVFGVVLLGVGEDGHFASIYPGAELLKDNPLSPNGPLCIATDHPTESVSRISLTPACLLAARNIFVLVKGEKKASIVKRVLEGDESYEELPARLLAYAEHPVRWFIDSEAAQHLERFRS